MTCPKAQLTVLEGKSKGSDLVMDAQGTYRIGRAGHSQLQVKDASVSREHCHIESDGQYYWLVDSGSANGTFVNGQRVQRYMLYDRDLIRLGRIAVEFRLLLPQ